MEKKADTDVQFTPLHALHLELGAKLVPFAGYAMPLQYRAGILHEHLHTRANASLFDVSHMGQITVEGPAAALESLIPGDVAALEVWQQRYSVLTSETGGILDDLMITRLPEGFSLVVNAAFKTEDFAYLYARLGAQCAVTHHTDRALLALQGPAAVDVLRVFAPAIAGLRFMTAGEFLIAGVSCVVSRSGYTGEDGFEIAADASAVLELARALLCDSRVAPAGLGARDSLRLEAGLCLAGTDIDATTTPVEAGLGWTVARKYRDPATSAANFPGARIILGQLSAGTARIRIGLQPQGRVAFRNGVSLCSVDGTVVGRVTSGSFGPSVNAPIAMAYVERPFAAPGTPLMASIREREQTARVVPLPFLPHRYYRG